MKTDFEGYLSRLGLYADISGHSRLGNSALNNGDPALSCMRNDELQDASLCEPENLERHLPGITLNLTAAEARTLCALLADMSVSEIARAEGVSRTAIYSRIRGDG